MTPDSTKKSPNIDFPLPVPDYPLSDFQSGVKGAPVAHRVEQPINTNPDISTPAPSAEKFGMGRGPQGAS